MRGSGLVLLLFFFIGIFHYSRWALPEMDELPAVVRYHPKLATVVVTDNQGSYGLYQFYDGCTIVDVIKLTVGVRGGDFLPKDLSDLQIFTGESIKVVRLQGNYLQVERSWLSARHRMLLQIPLHPDRMVLNDWETLPGIGPSLAQAIESDRQENGDFNEFAALDRVKGVGSKKLEVWKEYFEGKNFRFENK